MLRFTVPEQASVSLENARLPRDGDGQREHEASEALG